MTDAPVLVVDDLSVDYEVAAGRFHALSNVSFEMLPGRVTGIVGETGCGKSTLAHAIPGLLPSPPARIRSGKVVFQGTDLTALPRWKLPTVRGTGIGMVFQEPLNSLNPAYRVFDQVAEAIRVRRLREKGAVRARSGGGPFDYSRGPATTPTSTIGRPFLPGGPVEERMRSPPVRSPEIWTEVLEALRLVRINDPETILRLYPHELSGGMRQRIMIAQTLAERPSLLIADEPTSALDVTIQAQVLTLMKELIDEIRTSILFISHDLGVIAEMADDVGVMYAGRVIEFGPVASVFEHPRHPYTRALLRAAPDRSKADGPLESIPGSVPSLARLPGGCAFHPRCVYARPNCGENPGPSLRPVDPADPLGHRSACWYAAEIP